MKPGALYGRRRRPGTCGRVRHPAAWRRSCMRVVNVSPGAAGLRCSARWSAARPFARHIDL